MKHQSTKAISRDMIDDIMHASYLASIKSAHQLRRWAHDAIAYQINTGRASADCIRALNRANMDKLHSYMLRGKYQSNDALLARMVQYLRRYCKYDG